MSATSENNTECRRYEQLRAAELEGAPGSSADRRFLVAHRRRCDDCRTLDAVLDVARWQEEDAPCERMDELSRRRLVNDAVAAAAAADQADQAGSADQADQAGSADSAAQGGSVAVAEEEIPGEVATARHPLRGLLPRLAFAVAAVALVVGALLWSPWRGNEQSLSPPSVAATSARLMLLAGRVNTDSGNAELSQRLGAGQWLETGPAASAVLRLPAGAMLLLAERSRLRLLPSASVVALDRGSVLALVHPQRPGARFSVITRQGRVQVKGTVFQVTAGESGSSAAVLRGRVLVAGSSGAKVLLSAGQRVGVGSRIPTLLSARQSRRLWQRVKLLDLLQAERPASLAVTSHPAGARVVVDGVTLGTTPLAVSLRPGHRRLEVAADGHVAVLEHVLLVALGRTTRDFELRRLVASSPNVGGGDRETDRGVSSAGAPGRAEAGASSRGRPRARAHSGTGKRQATPSSRDLRRALLNRAQLLRAAREWHNAVRAYRELIRRYPASAEATTALVSLGILQLRHLGQPLGALASFDRYLRRSRRGVLAREAAYGRILALRSLGRRAQEIRAMREFLRLYPRALRAPRVGRRLRSLAGASAAAKAAMGKR